MNKWRHLYIDIYGINIYFMKCNDKKYFERCFDSEFGPSIHFDGNGCFAVGTKDNTEIGVIWVRNWAQLCHEVFHAVCWIMKSKDIPLCSESEEAYAYLIDYITRLIKKRK